MRCQGVNTHIGVISDAAGGAESDGTRGVLIYWFRETPGAVDKIEPIGLRGHFKRTSEFMGRDVDGMDARRSWTRNAGGRNEVWIDHLRSYLFRTEGCRDAGSLYEIEKRQGKLQYSTVSPISERCMI